PGVAQFRGPSGEIIDEAQTGGLLVACAGTERAFDEQTGAAQRAGKSRVARLARVELRSAEAIPMRPFGENFRQDPGERGFEIRSRAVNDAVLQAERVRQAREPAP